MTTLQSAEDFKWLKESHGVPRLRAKIALLYGHEDCPTKVELYRKNHYQTVPIVFVANEDGKLIRSK